MPDAPFRAKYQAQSPTLLTYLPAAADSTGLCPAGVHSGLFQGYKKKK